MASKILAGALLLASVEARWTNVCPANSFEAALQPYLGAGITADGTTRVVVTRTGFYVLTRNDSVIDQLCPTALSRLPDGSAQVSFGNVTLDSSASCALINRTVANNVTTLTLTRTLPTYRMMGYNASTASLCPAGFQYNATLAASAGVSTAINMTWMPGNSSIPEPECPSSVGPNTRTVDESLRLSPRYVMRSDNVSFQAMQVDVDSIYLSRGTSAVSQVTCVFNSTNTTVTDGAGSRTTGITLRFGNVNVPTSVHACVLFSRTAGGDLLQQGAFPGAGNNASALIPCAANFTSPLNYSMLYLTPSATPSATPSVSPSSSATASATGSASGSRSASVSRGASATASATSTATGSASATPVNRLSDGATVTVVLRFNGFPLNASNANITLAMQRDVSNAVTANLFPLTPAAVAVTARTDCNVTANGTRCNNFTTIYTLNIYIASPGAVAGQSAAQLNSSLQVAIGRANDLTAALLRLLSNATTAQAVLSATLPAMSAASNLSFAALIPTILSVNVSRIASGVLPAGTIVVVVTGLSDGAVAALVIFLLVVPLGVAIYFLTPHGRRTAARLCPSCCDRSGGLHRNKFENAGVVSVNYAPVLQLGSVPPQPGAQPVQLQPTMASPATTLPAGIPMAPQATAV